MKIAMYKGPAKSLFQRFFHWLTCMVTGSVYSHCELVIDVNIVQGYALCMSSSMRDGGVRLKQINLSSGHWDVFDLPTFSPADRQRALQWFIDHENEGYDWLGLLWFLIPVSFEKRRRWFCSEAIAASLNLPDPHKLHPQRLLDILSKEAARVAT